MWTSTVPLYHTHNNQSIQNICSTAIPGIVYNLFTLCSYSVYIYMIQYKSKQHRKGSDLMVHFETYYDYDTKRYGLQSRELDENDQLPIWLIQLDTSISLPFTVEKYINGGYEHYGEYKTLDRVMQVTNGLETTNMLSQLLNLADGKNVILQFGQDITLDYHSFMDEKVYQIHFTSPNEVTFIMERQTIPGKEVI